MVKALLLGLLVATICGPAKAGLLPAPAPAQEDAEDPAARSERSTNLTGTARRIQMFIKNRHLQILPDGTVNGTTDDTSPYSILQRTTVGIGRMKIQGLATCQYLCMSRCGLLYGSREFGDECVFNETIEQSNYNTYSSCKYSNDKRTFYLALNQRGQPRKVMLRARNQLGKLSSYILVLTRGVDPGSAAADRDRQLSHGCPPAPAPAPSHALRHRAHQQHCPKRRKRKKKRKFLGRCADGNGEQCQRDKRRKSAGASEPKRRRKGRKGSTKKRLNPVEAEPTTTTAIPDYLTAADEDYVETSTHADWDDAKNTISPLADSD